MNRFLVLVLFMLPGPAHAQWESGVEADVLPYLTGGWFGAGWVGSGHVRVRTLVAEVNMPSFIVKDGFKDNEITSVAVVADVFRTAGFEGWWLSAGPVRWAGSIRHESGGPAADYTSWLLHGGLGFARFLTGHLYVSPWAGLSLRVAGDDDIEAGGEPWNPPLLNPEASLKAGWRF